MAPISHNKPRSEFDIEAAIRVLCDRRGVSYDCLIDNPEVFPMISHRIVRERLWLDPTYELQVAILLQPLGTNVPQIHLMISAWERGATSLDRAAHVEFLVSKKILMEPDGERYRFLLQEECRKQATESVSGLGLAMAARERRGLVKSLTDVSYILARIKHNQDGGADAE